MCACERAYVHVCVSVCAHVVAMYIYLISNFQFILLFKVVDHYSRSADGLLCALGDPCNVTAPATFAVQPPGPKRIDPNSLIVSGELG